jgi:hypothetical protein
MPSTVDSTVSTAALPISVLSDKHERFVQELVSNGGNVSDAYRTVYPHSGDQDAVWASACRLKARADVKARIAEITAAAAERAMIKPTELLRELADIVHADPAELSRVVACACDLCWTEPAIAAAWVDYQAAVARGETVRLDMSQPRPGCPSHPSKHRTVVYTPTDQLSGPVRRLIRSVRAKGDDIDVQVIDQLAARVELHTLLKMRVSQSISAHVAVDPSKPNPWASAEQSPADILAREMKKRRARSAPVVTVEQPPPAQDGAAP